MVAIDRKLQERQLLGSHNAYSLARYHDTGSAGMGTLIMDIAGNTAESTTSNFIEGRAEDLSVTRAETRGVEQRGQKRGRQAFPAALPSAADWQNLIADMGTVHLRDSVRKPQVSGCCLLGSVGAVKINNGPKNMSWVVRAVGRNNAGAQSPTRPPPTNNNRLPGALDRDPAPTFLRQRCVASFQRAERALQRRPNLARQERDPTRHARPDSSRCFASSSRQQLFRCFRTGPFAARWKATKRRGRRWASSRATATASTEAKEGKGVFVFEPKHYHWWRCSNVLGRYYPAEAINRIFIGSAVQ